MLGVVSPRVLASAEHHTGRSDKHSGHRLLVTVPPLGEAMLNQLLDGTVISHVSLGSIAVKNQNGEAEEGGLVLLNEGTVRAQRHHLGNSSETMAKICEMVGMGWEGPVAPEYSSRLDSALIKLVDPPYREKLEPISQPLVVNTGCSTT